MSIVQSHYMLKYINFNGAQNGRWKIDHSSPASIAGSRSCLSGSFNYNQVCAETAHFSVSFCSTAEASGDKNKVQEMTKGVDFMDFKWFVKE